MARITNVALQINNPVKLTMEVSTLKELFERLLSLDVVYPTLLTEAWNKLYKKEPILMDVVLDGLFQTLTLTSLHKMAQAILDALPKDADFGEVYYWMSGMTLYDALPTDLKHVVTRTKALQELVDLKTYALNKVREKLARETADEASGSVPSKEALPALQGAKKGTPRAQVDRVKAAKTSAVLHATAAFEQLTRDEPTLSMQAYVGRLNSTVIKPILEAYLLKSTTAPKREQNASDRMQITFYHAPAFLSPDGKAALHVAFGQVFKDMLHDVVCRSKSVTIEFTRFPEA